MRALQMWLRMTCKAAKQRIPYVKRKKHMQGAKQRINTLLKGDELGHVFNVLGLVDIAGAVDPRTYGEALVSAQVVVPALACRRRIVFQRHAVSESEKWSLESRQATH